MPTLEEMRDELVAARATKTTLDEQYTERRKAIDEQIAKLNEDFRNANAELIREQQTAGKQVDVLERALRGEIVERYKAAIASDPKAPKTLGPGLSVQVRHKFEITDEEAALGWAAKNAPFIVRTTVDKIELELIAQKHDFPFVQHTQQVSAVIKL